LIQFILNGARRFIPGGSFSRAVVHLASGNAGVQAIGLLTAPITARIFAPAESGLAAVFLNLTAIASGLACARYDQAIPLPESRATRLDLLALCLRILPLTVALSILIVSFAGRALANLLNEPALENYLVLLPLAILLTAVTQMLSNWFTREAEFGVIVRSKLRQSVLQIGFQISTGALTHGSVWILLWGSVLGNVAAVVTCLRRLGADVTGIWQRAKCATLSPVAHRYRQFPLFNSWSAVVDSLGQTLPVFIMTSLHGAQETGWLRMAQTLVSLPVAAVSSAVANVYWSEAARRAAEAPHTIRSLYLRTTVGLAVGGALLVLGSLVLPALVPVVFGSRWGEAGSYAVVMAFPAACALLSAPAVNLATLGFNHWEAGWVIVRLALTAIAATVAHKFDLSPLATLQALATALVAGYGLLIVLNLVAIREFLRRQR
jgi:O-antigen/teichoic acid export membrane protein